MTISIVWIQFVGLFFGCFLVQILSDCALQNFCNGNGQCIVETSSCSCFAGYGAASDITLYRAADCSARTCPAGKAWADVPTSPTAAHALAECSTRGSCDRALGVCSCFPGFTGAACQRSTCPNGCSGHGACVSIAQMAQLSYALPLGPNTYYEGNGDSTTWDEQSSFGCVCDSSWSVGLGPGQSQTPEWFGADCSLRHCPSADDPMTHVNETNCYRIKAENSQYYGEQGNLCHVECANRGICDHSTGFCQCFNGFYGPSCNIRDPTAVYSVWNNGQTTQF